ncbi:TetR/AcrR family transcriptional regulator [Aquincola sp. S2]|uniref:TetR/AcrR family transcriptional regulator n=1 Tax=Pseudaquabacterium terrae TaxID=2732868 RepID=A0ABX2ESC6_9BURK|nr:TetR/AcrR family transcriptional regulator [Aquabacterium terrae]NRF71600.1 TetR/AcrR family transcriptional regulator [Aquabacterium terrae]
MTSTLKPRRKPSQSRAWITSGAIQEALVRLLLEQPYETVSMREIASLAGVGLGTLYRYFPSKDSIAAVTVRGWMRKQAAAVAAAARADTPRTLQQTIDALVAAHVQPLAAQSAEWRALLTLERRISSPESYREIYREFVALFRDALAAASDWPAGLDAQHTADSAFAIVHALVIQALLVRDECPPADVLIGDVQRACSGVIAAAR